MDADEHRFRRIEAAPDVLVGRYIASKQPDGDVGLHPIGAKVNPAKGTS